MDLLNTENTVAPAASLDAKTFESLCNANLQRFTFYQTRSLTRVYSLFSNIAGVSLIGNSRASSSTFSTLRIGTDIPRCLFMIWTMKEPVDVEIVPFS